MSRRLIVNADDLGLSRPTNRAILESCQHGIVTSTTALVNLPDAAQGILLMQQLAPDTGIGLHVNLTEGRPVLDPKQVPSLVRDDGAFHGGRRTLWAMRRWRAGEVAAEVAAQFDRFVDMAGTAPDHLDSHHFVANYSTACLDAVLALSDQYDLPIRKTDHTLLEIMVDRPAYVGAGRNLLATLLMPLFRSQVTVYRRHPRPRTTDRLEASFYGRGASLKRLLRILARLPDGLTEIMCHPGVTARSQGKGPGQDGELAILTHDDVEAMISQKGIQLISYAALGD